MHEWRVFPDVDALVGAAMAALRAQVEHALEARGAFDLVLAGGRTPAALYRALAEAGAGNAHWQIWYGDERCLPAGDPERNNVMAETAWLAGSDVPEDNWHVIPAELGAAAGRDAYARALEGVGDFDLVLLGVGEDGHTASLFPDGEWGRNLDSPDVLAVRSAPKPPPERVSLSAARLSRSRAVWFIVTGSNKRDAVQGWRDGRALPAAAVSGHAETVVWLDAEAAGSLD